MRHSAWGLPHALLLDVAPQCPLELLHVAQAPRPSNDHGHYEYRAPAVTTSTSHDTLPPCNLPTVNTGYATNLQHGKAPQPSPCHSSALSTYLCCTQRPDVPLHSVCMAVPAQAQPQACPAHQGVSPATQVPVRETGHQEADRTPSSACPPVHGSPACIRPVRAGTLPAAARRPHTTAKLLLRSGFTAQAPPLRLHRWTSRPVVPLPLPLRRPAACRMRPLPWRHAPDTVPAPPAGWHCGHNGGTAA